MKPSHRCHIQALSLIALFACPFAAPGALVVLNEGVTTTNSAPLLNSGDDYEFDTNLAGAATLDNSSTWTQSGATTLFFYNSNGSGVFNNLGTFDQSTTGPAGTQINSAFNNAPTGLLNVNSGYLYLQGGGTHDIGSVINVASGVAGYFNGGTHTFNGGTLTGGGYMHVSAGTVTLAGNVGAAVGPATGGFGITGGSVNGTGTLSVDHGYFYNGNVDGAAVIRLTGSSVKEGPFTLSFLNGGTLQNEGIFAHTGGSFDLDASGSAGAGTIINAGSWTTSGTGTLFCYNTNGSGVFNNLGTFDQSTTGPAGTQIFSAFNNTGTGIINVNSGYLYLQGGGTHDIGSVINVVSGVAGYFNGGTHTFNGGTFTGGGTMYLSQGNIIMAGEVGDYFGTATGGFGMTGGRLGGTGTISVDHGSFYAGELDESALIRLGGSSTKSGASTLNFLNGGTLQNDGAFDHVAGNFDLDAGSGAGAGLIRNTGTWTTSGTGTLIYHNSNGEGVFLNEGTFIQNTTGAANTFVHAAFNNTSTGTINSFSNSLLLQGGGTHDVGSVINADGGDVYFNGGTHTLNGGTLTGNNSVYATLGTVLLAGNVGASRGAATGGFGIAGGTVTGNGKISADHGYFSTGQMDDAAVIRLTGASTKVTSSTLSFLNGGTISNEGSFAHNSGGFDLDANGGAGAGTISNFGTWTTSGTSDLIYYNTYGSGVFSNSGTLVQNTSGLANTFVNSIFNNNATGTISATSNAIILQGGGTHAAGSTFNAEGGSIYFNGGTHTFTGGAFTGTGYSYLSAGTVAVMGNVGPVTGPAQGGFGISGGNLVGNFRISVDHAYFSTGTLDGESRVRITGVGTKETAGIISFLNGGTIRNEGSFTHSAGGFDLDANGGSAGGLIQNNGTWTTTGSSDLTYYNTNGEGNILNHGSLVQNSSGTTTFHAPLTNFGTVTVSTGSLVLNNGSHSEGTYVANSSLVFGTGSHVITGATAQLKGTGTVFGSVLLTDGATLAPGNSPGTLSVYGSLSFTDGTTSPALFVELNGIGAGEFDVLQINSGGSVNFGFDTTLLQFDLNYTPNLGETYRIVDGTEGTGSFSGRFKGLPNSGDSFYTQDLIYGFSITYGDFGKYIDLTVVAVPEPSTWAALAGAAVLGAALIRRRWK